MSFSFCQNQLGYDIFNIRVLGTRCQSRISTLGAQDKFLILHLISSLKKSQEHNVSTKDSTPILRIS